MLTILRKGKRNLREALYRGYFSITTDCLLSPVRAEKKSEISFRCQTRAACVENTHQKTSAGGGEGRGGGCSSAAPLLPPSGHVQIRSTFLCKSRSNVKLGFFCCVGGERMTLFISVMVKAEVAAGFYSPLRSTSGVQKRPQLKAVSFCKELGCYF